MTLYPGTIALEEPDRPAVIFGDDVLTYAALERQSAEIAAMLHAIGLAFGDVIAILVGNRPEFFSVAWAAQRSGLYYVPIPTRLTALEVAYLLKDSGAKALFVDPALQDLADEASQGIDIARYGLDIPEQTYPPAPMIEGGDMLYTSGSTGRPKGVRRPLRGDALGSDESRITRARTLFGLDRDSVFLSPAPLYHAAPLRFTMNLLRVGGTVIGMQKFDAAGALRLIAQHQVTHSQWVPTMFNRLVALPESERLVHDLSSHKVAIHAGAPCAPQLKHQMIDWWGPILHEYYSGTESVGFTHVTSREWVAKPGTVGRPYGCNIHILDDNGTPVAPGETGIVYFEGKAGLSYHNDSEKTAAAHNQQGWATMGDIGHVDADGYLFLTDRRAFTIISGGVNVYPAEVEAALSGHPLVRDVAVFGVPDADLGETVFALIELHDDVTGSQQLADELATYARGSLAPFKIPRRIAFASVERSETGKIRKADLRALHGASDTVFRVSNAARDSRSSPPLQPA
jgi:long-chain acyl-CoA synthetase